MRRSRTASKRVGRSCSPRLQSSHSNQRRQLAASAASQFQSKGSMTEKNETFTDRVKAGRALVFAAAAIKPFESTKAIGSIGGFAISIERFDERATLLIHGKHG